MPPTKDYPAHRVCIDQQGSGSCPDGFITGIDADGYSICYQEPECQFGYRYYPPKSKYTYLLPFFKPYLMIIRISISEIFKNASNPFFGFQ